MSRGSLVQRLSALQQLVAAALIATFAGSAIWVSARTLERQESVFLDQTVNQLAQHFHEEWAEEHDVARAARLVLGEDATPGVRIDILDLEGRTIASTATPSTRPMPGARERRMRVAPGVWIHTAMSTGPRRDALRALGLALLLSAVPLLLASFLVGRWSARRVLQPLSRMAADVERFSERALRRPLDAPDDPSEVAALAQSFDRLVVRLDDMIRAERHFAEDAAHELRTPLTALSGEIEYALSDASLDARHRAGLMRASSQVKAMTELVDALLLLRRSEQGYEVGRSEFSPVNLADLARDAVRAQLRAHPERTADVVTEADDEVLVAGHPVLLASALGNLISNAIKFTEPGQSVHVAVHASNGSCGVVVEDAGCGIPAEDRETIFDTFYRSPEARASKQGFGLGLPILRRVARAHGGDVRVSASELSGARFELRLPSWTPNP